MRDYCIIFEKKRVLALLLNWVRDFLKKRRTILMINKYTLLERRTKVNISQNSSLSFILYLFYNVDLLKNCDDIKLRTSIIDFVNNVNILTYNDFTKRNCEKWKEIYDKCEKWCETHDSRFNIDKCRIELIERQIDAKTNIRMLEIQLNFKFRWKSDVRQL